MQSLLKREPPPSFYTSIYSQIEEVGWQKLLNLEDDLSSLTFQLVDEKGKTHVLEIRLPRNYPECSPSISADVPYLCDLVWSRNSRLKCIVEQFTQHLDELQEFWSTMDEVDRNLRVVGPKQLSNSATYRQINIGNGCNLLLSIDARNPRSLPECRFFGPDMVIEPIWKNWNKNGRHWKKTKRFDENLATLLELVLSKPPLNRENEEQTDCGICYAQYLPIDEELGVNSGSIPDYKCENPNCGKAFHTVCLRDWLHAIPTTRQSFDVLFGNCPYCSDPVAVKSTTSK